MKFLLIVLFTLIPLHAILVTLFKCKFGVDTDIARFWKEGIIIILFLTTVFKTYIKYNGKITRLYKNNYILGMATTFGIISFIFVFFPYFHPKVSSFLGFKYDVFFIIALIIGLYLDEVKQNMKLLLKIIFGITGVALIIFLPWYLFGNIAIVSDIFGFSNEVSTYSANKCISFSQNVHGEHRFQGTFSGPIRWSVFLTVIYLTYLGSILNFLSQTKKELFVLQSVSGKKYSQVSYLLLIIPSILVITAIFFSYSKTSILGLGAGILLFIYLVFTKKYKRKISKKIFTITTLVTLIPVILIIVFKKDLFLHLGAVINRLDNLSTSIQMYLYNPIGYGLGVAGPATWVGQSIESAGSWELAMVSLGKTHKFLPENWYMQILLEQGIVGLIVFISLLLIIAGKLLKIVKRKKDFLSIGIFSSYITLLFMANFTHAFEESATSYILFIIIGAYISQNNIIKEKIKEKHKL